MTEQTSAFANLVLEAITHAVIAKRIIYGRWQQHFIEGKGQIRRVSRMRRKIGSLENSVQSQD
jgi:hypothetical protein